MRKANDELRMPTNFDDYVDARKEGFIRVKNFKENGGRLIGFTCSYTPLELFEAAGASSIGLCGTDNTPIADAERHIPANMCPLIKSTYGFALTETCPYTWFSDMIVGETTCDGKKKMYELLNDLKPTYVIQLPQAQNRPYAGDIWYEECKLLLKHLENFYGITITDDDLREAVRKRNEFRKAYLRLFELQTFDPPAMTGTEVAVAMQRNLFYFNIEEVTTALNNTVDEALAKYKENPNYLVANNTPRVLLTGCPTGGVINKVCKVIEENGAIIVSNDNCSGERTTRMMIDPEADDILRAISDRYLSISCAVMSPNEDRIKNTIQLCKDYKVDGVVDVVLQACHPFNIEAKRMEDAVKRELGIPYLKIETDYSDNDVGQLLTRISAFIEIL